MKKYCKQQKDVKPDKPIKKIRVLTGPIESHEIQITQQEFVSEISKDMNQGSMDPSNHPGPSLPSESNQELRNLRSMENGFHVRKLYQRFQLMDQALFVLLIINLASIASYVQLEMKTIKPVINLKNINIVTNPDEIQKIEQISSFVLWLNSVITLIAIPVCFLRYQLQRDFQATQKKLTSPIYQFFQIILILMQPYPFINDLFVQVSLENSHLYPPIFIKLNLILVIIGLTKIILVLRYMFWHNFFSAFRIKSQKFFGPSFTRICKMYSCQKNYTNSIKCIFKENFLAFIGVFFMISIISSAYSLRIIESHFDARFSFILDCLWFSLVSMSTIGYGDMFVTTPIGIVFDGYLMMSGVVIASFLFSSLNNIFTLNYQQKRALGLIKRLKRKSELKQRASIFIAKTLGRRWRQKKTGQKLPVTEDQRISCRMFRQLRKSLVGRDEKHLNVYSDMKSQFESLKLQITQLMKKSQDDIDSLNEKMRVRLVQNEKREKKQTSYFKYYELIKAKCIQSRMYGQMKSSEHSKTQDSFYDQLLVSEQTTNAHQQEQAQQFDRKLNKYLPK